MEVLNKLSVGEAFNSNYYGDWNMEEFDPQNNFGYNSAYITESNPAKKITFKKKAGHADANYESDDYLFMIINGDTNANKLVYIDWNDFPFTISGLMITSLRFFVVYGEGTADEPDDTTKDLIELISYH